MWQLTELISPEGWLGQGLRYSGDFPAIMGMFWFPMLKKLFLNIREKRPRWHQGFYHDLYYVKVVFLCVPVWQPKFDSDT